MSKGIDPLLGDITVIQLSMVEDQLTNNDESPDEELQELFMENGMTEEQAKRALTYRQRYLLNMYLQGSTPILVGDDAMRFNPHTKAYEREDTSPRPLPAGKKRKS